MESKPCNVKVYVRVKPVESEQQSAALVEPLDDTSLRVQNWTDSPFKCDGVISSDSSDIYKQTCQQLPQHLIDGHHATLLVYGAGQSGKTSTLFDEQHGVIQPLVQELFQLLQSQRISECILQCSVAELYLECVHDLLLASPANDTGQARIHCGALVGCMALSCLNEADVLQVMRRAQAARTVAHDYTQSNNHRHSSKSTLVIQLTLQTVGMDSDERRTSRLLIVDCAPHQYTASDDETMVTSEAMQALHRYVCERIDIQQQSTALLNGPTMSRDNVSKLPLVGQLLLHSLGSNCFTSVIVCVSPQQESSLSALQFGKDCRLLVNDPRPNIHHAAWQDCTLVQAQAIDKMEKMETIVRALAEECVRLRSKGTSFLVNKQLWNMIDEISASEKEARPLDFVVENRTEHEHKVELMKLRSELRRAEDDRDKATARAAKIKTDLQSLKEQAKTMNSQYREQRMELEQLRAENTVLKHRKGEVEHNLRTSLFRESEAVVFLRQFRKFYSRLLHKMAKEGSGDVTSIINNIPGAPDMSHMVDIDRMMVDSGLLEEDEIGKDNAPKDYRPSRLALQRSSKAVTDAEALLHTESVGNDSVAGIASVKLSIVIRPETGETTEARQRLFQTPSGRYIDMREKELEADLLRVSDKCTALQNQLESEKAKTAALANGDASSAVLKAALELRSAEEKLKKKEKDWQAVILKMNELHLSSKDARDKVDNRDQHVIYLEASLAESHLQHKQLITTALTSDNNLRSESNKLRAQLESVDVPLWQFSEPGTTVPTLSSRVVLPFSTTSQQLEEADVARRLSCSEHETWVDLYFKPRLATAAASIGNNHGFTASVPITTTNDEPEKGIDSLLFMEDESKDFQHVCPDTASIPNDDIRASSNHYHNLVDAYNSASASPMLPSDAVLATQDGLVTNQSAVESSPLSPPLTAPLTSTVEHPTVDPVPVALPQTAPLMVHEAKSEDKAKPPTNSIMERLKAKAEAAANKEGDEDDGVPEWMKKFKKIGAKNANEEVLETQGAAGAREYGRTAWETLKLHDRKATPATELFSQSKVKWTPRVKHGSDSDSDDDRYPSYSPYPGGAAVKAPSESESDDESDTQQTTANKLVQDEDVKDEAINLPFSSPASMPIRQGSDSDSDSSNNSKPTARSAPPPVSASVSKPLSKPESDSDSSEDEKETRKPFVSRADSDSSSDSKPTEAKEATPLNKDSDSDSSEEIKQHTHVPSITRPPTRKTSDSDSDSSEDSKPVKPVVPALPVHQSVAAGNDSDSESSDDPRPTNFVARNSIKPSTNSDSDSDSSEDAKPQTRQGPVATNDSDIDSDSSEDSKPKIAASVVSKNANANESDSDSDSSEDSRPKDSKAARNVPPARPTNTKGSDSDSDSSDDSKPKTTLQAKTPTISKKDDSDSESDSDSSADSKPTKIAPPPAPTPPPVVQKAEADEDDGFGGWSKPTQKSIGGGKPKRTAKDSDSDSDDSTDRQSPVRTTSSTLSRSVLTKKTSVDGDTTKEKQKFVIMNGKLVKSDSRSDLMAGTAAKKGKTEKKPVGNKKAASTAKPAFVIVDGKLVKTDAGGATDKKSAKKKGSEAGKKKKKG
ncbi:hypothetical protein MPSEU_000858800 [Mayamaea pseudoterrestris]|nr:hypothetical protein MPSEU_000858800 [Mayamaea pseudoterrestris]